MSSISEQAWALIVEARRRWAALDEPTGKRLLALYGIAVPRACRLPLGDAASLRAGVRTALDSLAPPLVLKIIAGDVLHKSDIGGVALGLENEDAILAEMQAMAGRVARAGHALDGYLLEESAPPGYDLVIGSFRDPGFGQVVMIGLGGIFVEILEDVAFRLCPITRHDVLEMLAELKGARLLKGARGGAVASEPAFVDAVLAVAGDEGLLADVGHFFAEVDINPLIVSPTGAVAVDARFVLADREEAARGPVGPPADDPATVVEAFRPLFAPRSIAVLGVSGQAVGQGNSFIRSLRSAGFGGAIYPIHPTESVLEGLPAYRSLGATPEPVDYAFVAIPAARVAEALRAGSGRVRFAQIMASGFDPDGTGPDSANALLETARSCGIRLLGPNCMGTYSPRGRVSFVDVGPAQAGSVGVFSQSGGLTIDILRRGVHRGLRFSGVVSLGNCLDIGPNDMLAYFLSDPGTQVIGAYLEDIRDGRRFFERLRDAGARKPVVLLKGGRSLQGQRAAASHTGSLASDERVWQALARQTGTVLVDDLEDFFDALVVLQAFPRSVLPPSSRIVLFGNGGGASVLAADAFSRHGLDVGPLRANTQAALAELGLPAGASLGNPIDVPANVMQKDPESLARRLLSIVASVEQPGAIVVHLNLPVVLGYAHVDILSRIVDAMIEVRRASGGGGALLLLVLRSSGQTEYEARRQSVGDRALGAGIPVFGDLAGAARALAALSTASAFRQRRSAARDL